MAGRERKVIVLLGEFGEFLMTAETVRRRFDRLLPALDAFEQRALDILKGLFRDRIPTLTDPVEDSPRLGLLFCFKTEKSILHGDVLVFRVEPHGLPELVARGLSLAGFQIGIGQVLADVRPSGGDVYRFEKQGNGAVVVFCAERLVGRRQGLIGGVRWLG
jgi:hypothetical protein